MPHSGTVPVWGCVCPSSSMGLVLIWGLTYICWYPNHHRASFDTGCHFSSSFETGTFSCPNHHPTYLGYPVSKLDAVISSSFETGHPVSKLDIQFQNWNCGLKTQIVTCPKSSLVTIWAIPKLSQVTIWVDAMCSQIITSDDFLTSSC